MQTSFLRKGMVPSFYELHREPVEQCFAQVGKRTHALFITVALHASVSLSLSALPHVTFF
jgi:hypothetical protein